MTSLALLDPSYEIQSNSSKSETFMNFPWVGRLVGSVPAACQQQQQQQQQRCLYFPPPTLLLGCFFPCIHIHHSSPPSCNSIIHSRKWFHWINTVDKKNHGAASYLQWGVGGRGKRFQSRHKLVLVTCRSSLASASTSAATPPLLTPSPFHPLSLITARAHIRHYFIYLRV